MPTRTINFIVAALLILFHVDQIGAQTNVNRSSGLAADIEAAYATSARRAFYGDLGKTAVAGLAAGGGTMSAGILTGASATTLAIPSLAVAGVAIIGYTANSMIDRAIEQSFEATNELIVTAFDDDHRLFDQSFERRHGESAIDVLTRANNGRKPVFLDEFPLDSQTIIAQRFVRNLAQISAENVLALEGNTQNIHANAEKLLSLEETLATISDGLHGALGRLHDRQVQLATSLAETNAIVDQNTQRLDHHEVLLFRSMPASDKLQALRSKSFLRQIRGSDRQALIAEVDKLANLQGVESLHADLTRNFELGITLLNNLGEGNEYLGDLVQLANIGFSTYIGLALGSGEGYLQAASSLSGLANIGGNRVSSHQAVMDILSVVVDNQIKILKKIDSVQIEVHRLGGRIDRLEDSIAESRNTISRELYSINESLSDIRLALLSQSRFLGTRELNVYNDVNDLLDWHESRIRHDDVTGLQALPELFVGPLVLQLELAGGNHQHALSSQIYEVYESLRQALSEGRGQSRISILSHEFGSLLWSRQSPGGGNFQAFKDYLKHKGLSDFSSLRDWRIPVFSFDARQELPTLEYLVEPAFLNVPEQGFNYSQFLETIIDSHYSPNSIEYVARTFFRLARYMKKVGTNREAFDSSLDGRQARGQDIIDRTERLALHVMTRKLYAYTDAAIAQQNLLSGINLFEHVYEDIMTFNGHEENIEAVLLGVSQRFQAMADSVLEAPSEEEREEYGREDISHFDDDEHISYGEYLVIVKELEKIDRARADALREALGAIELSDSEKRHYALLSETVARILNTPSVRSRFTSYLIFRAIQDSDAPEVSKSLFNLGIQNSDIAHVINTYISKAS